MRIIGWILLVAGFFLCVSIVWAAVGFLLMGVGLILLLVAEQNRRRARSANALSGERSDVRQAEPAVVPKAASVLTNDATRRTSLGAPSYDEAAWRRLVQNDSDLLRVTLILAEYGQRYVDELAEGYLAATDKTRVPAIIEGIITTANRNVGSRKMIGQAGEPQSLSSKGEPIVAISQNDSQYDRFLTGAPTVDTTLRSRVDAAFNDVADEPFVNPTAEEIIVDPREAIALLPRYLREKLNIQFHWGKAVTAVRSGAIQCGQESVRADQIFICSGSDFETLYPEEYLKYPLTKCKLQMMRLIETGTPRIGPAICGGLSLIHYPSFKASDSLEKLKNFYRENLPEYLTWGIHVMVSQNHLGHLTVGDSHEYGLSPDPFDKKHINDLILEYLSKFTALRQPKIIETWNGVYAKFTNEQTELFFSPDPEVYIINGVGGNGMTMSFGLAEELISAL